MTEILIHLRMAETELEIAHGLVDTDHDLDGIIWDVIAKLRKITDAITEGSV